jgi:hypothetical protein
VRTNSGWGVSRTLDFRRVGRKQDTFHSSLQTTRPSGYPSSLRASPLPFLTLVLVRTAGPDRSVNMAHHHHTPRGSLERRVHGLGVDGANRSVSSFAGPLSELDNKSDGSSITIKASKFSQWDRGRKAAAGLGLTGADAETDLRFPL